MKIFYLFLGFINFIVFAYDIEYNRDVTTWLWLLTSLLSFGTSFLLYIKDYINKK